MLVSLASPFYDLALHVCVLSTILTVLATLLLVLLLLLLYIYIYILLFGVKTKLSTLSRMSPCYFAIAHTH